MTGYKISLLAMTSVIVEKCVFICFVTFYILQAGYLKCCGAQGKFSLTLLLDGPGCVNNAFKKIVHCVNALKNLTL